MPTFENSLLLAGVGHPTLDSVAILFLGVLHSVGLAVLAIRLLRGLPPGTPYFSSSFVLALSPWLCFTLAGTIRLLQLGNIQFLDKPEEQIQPVLNGFLYGILMSGVSILIYSVAYHAAGRRGVAKSAGEPMDAELAE